MLQYSASDLTNSEIRRDLIKNVGVSTSAETNILVLLAEADLRKMYLEDGYPSMHAYCTGFFHFSRDLASQRIHVARTARSYPALFAAVEEGRLHLSAIRLIAPHLSPENVEELVAAATHRTCEEIEEMIARRFVRLETMLEGSTVRGAEAQSASSIDPLYAVRHIAPSPPDLLQVAPEPLVAAAPGLLVAAAPPISKPEPKPEPMKWIAVTTRAYEKLQRAQALVNEDVSSVVERGLDEVISKAEKRKFGATDKPRPPRPCKRARTIPAHVRRAVWRRDGGRCTFTAESGKRCESRRRLEFDHVVPVARGGSSTGDNLRLRCRAHNQLEAERVFGKEFMVEKRSQKRLTATEARAREGG
jgi:hypothetical protein